jgi:hypothetical protein
MNFTWQKIHYILVPHWTFGRYSVLKCVCISETLRVCACVRVYIYMYMYIYTFIYIYTHTNIHKFVCVFVYIFDLQTPGFVVYRYTTQLYMPTFSGSLDTASTQNATENFPRGAMLFFMFCTNITIKNTKYALKTRYQIILSAELNGASGASASILIPSSMLFLLSISN